VNRNPDSMPTEEVILEVSALQDEIHVRALRAHELGNSLHRRVRRNPTDDNTAIYLTYANAIVRFAGAISQVSARTTRTAKVLERLSQKTAETPRQKAAAPKKVSAVEELNPVESLINLYVNNAIVEAMSPDTGNETDG